MTLGGEGEDGMPRWLNWSILILAVVTSAIFANVWTMGINVVSAYFVGRTDEMRARREAEDPA